ncbi:MAG TPA: molybdopterin-binding protein [Anaerolineae bacterium]
MKLGIIPADQAVGKILVHNIVDAEGQKALSKGRQIRAEDIARLRALGKESVYVAIPEPGDVREDDAAVRLAKAAAGKGIEMSKPSGGRVNFYAGGHGMFRVNPAGLARLNALNGVTLATIAGNTAVAPKKMVATLKTIGLSLPETTLQQAEKIVQETGATLEVTPVKNQRAAIILTGTENGQARVQEIFEPPIRARLEELGARVIAEAQVSEDADAIGEMLEKMIAQGAQIVILAGETSIMDADDITPRGVRRAGGTLELYGAPVEPGNLLLLAYCGEVPVIGAPGCIKSRETNAVDLILPRLLAGERVTREDVNALAEGGLLIG